MNDRPRFVYALANQVLPSQIERKGLLGRKVVRFGPLLTVGGFLFEMGAILGHAFRDHLGTFAVPFSFHEAKPEAVEFLLAEGEGVARVLPNSVTINELFMMHEMLIAEPSRSPTKWAQWLLEHGDDEIQPEFAWSMVPVFGVRGAGFGAQYPQALEQLYTNSYEKVNVESWKEGHAAGLGIPPEPPSFPSFAEKQAEAVEGFREFCEAVFPEYGAIGAAFADLFESQH